MSGIPLQPGIIYGPLFSRRLGRSLGINLLPTTRKVCSYNCIYCQYGSMGETCLTPARSTLPTPTKIFAAVEQALSKPRSMDHLTFSGNGEPTLHPDFPEIVRGVKEIKDRLRPSARLAVLSNASRVNDPEVAAALRLVDSPMMKLDAGDEDTFQRINQPTAGIALEDILYGLARLPILMIQSVLIDGARTNIRGERYEAWATALGALKPLKVHIYSADRPTAQDNVNCIPPRKLQAIERDLTRRFGLNVQAFWTS